MPTKRGKTGRRGPRGSRGATGARGARGPSGPRVTGTEIIAAMQKEVFVDIRRQLTAQQGVLGQIGVPESYIRQVFDVMGK